MSNNNQSTRQFAVITCSTRNPRVGSSVAPLVLSTITAYLQNEKREQKIQVSSLDLADYPLPIFDEPNVPQTITDPANYVHEHTRKWSKVVSSFDGFIFVTPQYNWNVPSSLKNAVDYLFNEWTGKPAMIVSYGGRGGGKAAAALVQICLGLRMKVLEESVELKLEPKDRLESAMKYGKLLGDEETFWKEQLGKIPGLFEKMLE